jgi:hypothetical protein
MRQLILDKIGDTSILDDDDVHETRSRTEKKRLEIAAVAAETVADKMIVENSGEQNTPVVNVVNKVVIEHVKAAPNANPSGAKTTIGLVFVTTAQSWKKNKTFRSVLTQKIWFARAVLEGGSILSGGRG